MFINGLDLKLLGDMTPDDDYLLWDIFGQMSENKNQNISLNIFVDEENEENEKNNGNDGNEETCH